MSNPEKPLAAAFDNARGWMEQQERLLTEQQRAAYGVIRSRQALQQRQEQERLAAHRAQFEEQAKKKKLKADLILKPPFAIKDPAIEREIKNILAAESRLEGMDRSHVEERIEVLKKFEKEREQQRTRPTKELSASWDDSLRRTAAQEQDRDKTHTLNRDFDRST